MAAAKARKALAEAKRKASAGQGADGSDGAGKQLAATDNGASTATTTAAPPATAPRASEPTPSPAGARGSRAARPPQGGVKRVERPPPRRAKSEVGTVSDSGTVSDEGTVPGGRKKRRLVGFSELGWGARSDSGTQVVAVDVGAESVCITTFGATFAEVTDVAQPTVVLVKDPHAFRTLEPFSLEYGVAAQERWPSPLVLRGTHGSLLVPSQIGLVEFPAEHVLAGLVAKASKERGKGPKDVVLTLPTFLTSDEDERLRNAAAPWKKGAFRGVPRPVAAAYFYWVPALDEAGEQAASLPAWSRSALAAGQLLVLDWGAAGLEYGLVTVRRGSDEKNPTELRLNGAGVWPSLGGHRLTLSIAQDLRETLIDAILAQGPSEELRPRRLMEKGAVPRPPEYERAFEVLRFLGAGPLPAHEDAERRRLRRVLFPTTWRHAPGEEPPGYAPYRRLAVVHFKWLWKTAERLKRLLLSDPARHRKAGKVGWNLDRLDSPFTAHLDQRIFAYPAAGFLDRVEQGLEAFLDHLDRRLARRGVSGVHVALSGMQSSAPLLSDAMARRARSGTALQAASLAPCSSDPLELKSVANRGAALLARDKRKLDFGPPIDVLPFDLEIADCLGNVLVFAAGPIDELAVFQRRIRVEDGFPQLEFYVYASQDGTQRGPWGTIDFKRPFEFTERDRVFAVDPRYGFGRELPLLRELKKDEGSELRTCHDRTARGAGVSDGVINFRSYAPRESAEARRLLHFLEYGLTGEFHRKVYLLEREFAPPPMRFDYVYQRYYLSRAQELIVVREWWAPFEGGKLRRHKTLHHCQGGVAANAILGLAWGTY